MNIYVSNLSFNTTDVELDELYNLARYLLPKWYGQRKRPLAWFRFVEMVTTTSKDAMLGLNSNKRS
jgi:hypothetical protein